MCRRSRSLLRVYLGIDHLTFQGRTDKKSTLLQLLVAAKNVIALYTVLDPPRHYKGGIGCLGTVYFELEFMVLVGKIWMTRVENNVVWLV